MKIYEDKYLQLAQDLNEAKYRAIEAAAKSDDNGTCNFDSLMLELPRWNAKKIYEVADAVGLGCFKHYGSWWVFGVPVGCQANRHTAQAEAMYQYFKAMNYRASIYYQAD